MRTYTGEYLREIAFPLSGIGTGGISLAGDGRLIDWELTGRANKESVNGFSHFAIKAERGGKVLDARVLQGDLTAGFNGSSLASYRHSWGYGQGPNRTTLAGLPHFTDVSFCGEFPFAKLGFKGEGLPYEVTLSAFNPFIPMNEDDSSLPVCAFEWTVKNTADEAADFTVALSVGNPFKIRDGGCCEFSDRDGLKKITLTKREKNPSADDFGELAIATDCAGVSYQEYWYRSGWFDDLTTFWREFSAPGGLKNRRYDDNETRGQFDVGDMCTLCAKVSVPPHGEKKIRFFMAWYFPVFTKYWDEKKPKWKHEYVRRFCDLSSVLLYFYKNYDRLYGDSDKFRKALCEMTLPGAVTEAAADNLCVLKSPTCLRLENGEFWAFEGTNAHDGSCEGSCDHVWGYQYALPFLFPALARGMLDIDYKYNMNEAGGMAFRTMLPLGSGRWDFRPCADGQFGCVLRAYREWKFSGDDEWLRSVWESIKRSMEFAWSPENPDKWDDGKCGVLTGRQHHTLDMELFGPNPWLTGFYLAALRAASEMAAYLGEKDTASEYLALYEKGVKYVDAELFNGRHYIQKIDLSDLSQLGKYKYSDAYKNDETGEIKYQIGEGCHIDQLLAQWHASVIGLGDIFDNDHARTAAKCLYDSNFKSMREVFNPCRIFAANDEKGMVIATWSGDEYKPKIPVPYTEECMTGFEYAAAGLLIQKGFITEGVNVINAIRERYDGKKRNPFAEIECGSSYSRSMASFALPAVFSGFSFDATAGEMGFSPCTELPHKTFWSLANGWGTAFIGNDRTEINVLYGELALNRFKTVPGKTVKAVFADGKPVEFTQSGTVTEFTETLTAKEGIGIIFTDD